MNKNQLTIRLNEEVYNSLKKLSEQRGLSFNTLITLSLEKYFEDWEKIIKKLTST